MIQPNNTLPYAAPSPAGSISRPSTHDFQELLDVWEESVRATHYFLREEDILLFQELVPRYLEVLDLYCTRDAQGRINGFLGIAGDKIGMLFIRPDQRGLGLGRQLLSHAVQLGIRRVDVNEQNGQAVAFYEHAGFGVAGRSDNDGFGKPYPLLHMEYKPAQ